MESLQFKKYYLTVSEYDIFLCQKYLHYKNFMIRLNNQERPFEIEIFYLVIEDYNTLYFNIDKIEYRNDFFLLDLINSELDLLTIRNNILLTY